MTHPIIPPPELAQEWYNDKTDYFCDINRAAQWGSDQELEACCALLEQKGVPAWSLLRLHRRPKPPSLKEQALAVLTQYMTGKTILTKDSVDTIRRALEQLDD